MLGIVASSATSGGGGTPPGPLVIVNHANTSVADQSGGVYRVTKTGGTGGSDDASAVSSSSFSGDFCIRIRPQQADKQATIGVDSAPLESDDGGSIDRALFLDFTAIGVIDSGVWGGYLAATYTTASRLFIRRIGTAVTALLGTTDAVADAVLIHTFANLSGALFFDSSLRSSGGAFDIYAEAL